MIQIQRIFLFLCFLAFVQHMVANNISVSNISIIGKDITAGTNNSANFVYVKCDVSWENSWRTSSAPNNWDAAWLFVKYKVGTGAWKHATLHTSSHVAPTGSTIDASGDGKGIFMYRNADGTGSVSFTSAKLRWDYGADGVLDNDTVKVKVIAIEMVYVPQGSFYLGSGGGESGSFTDGSWTTGNTIPLQVTSEGALTIAQSSGNLWGTSTSGTNTIGSSGTLPAGFPKGFQAIYCMKYSISQDQYVDFLNTLTYNQQVTRTAVTPTSSPGTKVMFSGAQSQDRSGIEIQTSGIATSTPAIYTSTLKYLECNWISWADDIAYADWAGLRPMTELEFEKACRGTNSPVANQYAWDSAFLIRATGTSNTGLTNETALPDTANANYNIGIQGPLRVGNFARTTTTRERSGATYYGIMEMSGGVWERIVSVGDATGRTFTGAHGDGVLDSDGNATGVSNWPGTDAVGSGFRGGVWDSPETYMQISDRGVASLASSVRGGNSDNAGTRGFRAVRTAP